MRQCDLHFYRCHTLLFFWTVLMILGLCSFVSPPTATADNTSQTVTGEDGAIYSEDRTVLLSCPKEETSFTIPSTVTTIAEKAFSGCSSLENVKMPDSVTMIGDRAFEHCESLDGVLIPGTVSTIGKRAFWGCSSLENIEIPYSVKEIGESAFCLCLSLKSILIPDSVKRIEKAHLVDVDHWRMLIFPLRS